MNWEAVGAAGEVAGAMLVVISLAFVGVQLRQNTAATKHASRDATGSAAINALGEIYRDPDLARLFRDGMRNHEAIDPSERMRWHLMVTSLFLHFEVYYYQWRRGELDENIWAPLRIRIHWYFSQPGIQEHWWTTSLPLSAEFTTFLEEGRTSAAAEVAAANARIEPMFAAPPSGPE